MQHTYHDLKTVFDAMRYFLEKNLMVVECGLKLTLVPLPFDSHTQNVCGTLKEGDVVLTEFSLRATVDLQHPVRRAVALKNYVHCASNAVLNKQFWRSKSLFIFEVIGNYWFTGP
jgi:hypothetical protein